jgi:hypothetical protein
MKNIVIIGGGVVTFAFYKIEALVTQKRACDKSR